MPQQRCSLPVFDENASGVKAKGRNRLVLGRKFKSLAFKILVCPKPSPQQPVRLTQKICFNDLNH
jgi:hypothetical protein